MRFSSMMTFIGTIVLSACTPAPTGPSAPIALEQVGTVPVLAGGTARQTVLGFVAAYASAPRDGGAALSDLVTGPELENWVHWLIVQDAQFPGAVDGSDLVRSVSFVGVAPVKDAAGAQIDLSANVSFDYLPLDGQPFERTRILDGPVTLLAEASGGWRVLDLTRDGVSISDGIQLFKNEVRTVGDVRVRLDSLFMFPPNWQFNLIVENRTPDEIRLDPSATGLYVKGASGAFQKVPGAISPALKALPSNRGVQSMLSSEAQDAAGGRVLVLVFRGGGKEYRFDFPLGGIVTKAPPPLPTAASPSPSTG